jgi:electron transport complex protein RnfG
MFEEKIKPSLVLTLICLISCALLVVAYEATYVDNTGVVTDEMIEGLDEIYGYSDGFAMEEGDAPEGVTSVLSDESGNTAYEVTTDGYSSGGIHVLIGLDNSGSVSGIAILSLGETPGLGTKVRDEAWFREQFTGLTYDRLPVDSSDDSSAKKTYSWGSESEIASLKEEAASAPVSDTFELDTVTGASFSSKGMNRAVTIALTAYNNTKGVSGNE